MDNFEMLKSEIPRRFSGMSDFTERDFIVGNKHFCVFYIANFSSRDMINRFIIAPILEYGEKRKLFDTVGNASVKKVADVDSAESELLGGACVIISSAEDGGVSAMTKNEEGRSPSEPETENVIRGAHEGFTENGGNNAMFIRRRIKSTHLKKEDFSFGDASKTDVSIMYLDNIVREDVLTELRRRLGGIKINGVLDSGYVEMYIQDGKYPIFPTVGNSERPDKVAAKILEGRIAVIVDGSPVVLTVPYLFAEGFQVTEDYSKSLYFATFERILRFFGTLISLFLPAVFLALYKSPELMFGGFSEYLDSARENVHMSVMAEMVMVFLVFELVREVGLRMPKAVGSAVGIVGSLVLGDGAVEAGIISAPVLIVVAFSAVCNFLAPPYMNSNVIYRAFMIVSAGFFGIVGFFFAATVSLALFSYKKSFGTPYLSPIAPISGYGQTDFILMMPIWQQRFVPTSLSGKKIIRSEEKR